MNPIELTVIRPHNGSPHYMVAWPDDELGLTGIPEIYLDLLPPVSVAGLQSSATADRAFAGCRLRTASSSARSAAAMPKVNATAPVSQATRSIFHRSQHGG